MIQNKKITYSSKKGKNGSSGNLASSMTPTEQEVTERHELYGTQPVSPIQQSLFDNINSLTNNNQTNLFSGRSSGEKLMNLVHRMQELPQL